MAEEKTEPKLVPGLLQGASHAYRSFDIISDWVFEDEEAHIYFHVLSGTSVDVEREPGLIGLPMMHKQVHFSVVFPQWSGRRMRQCYNDMTSMGTSPDPRIPLREGSNATRVRAVGSAASMLVIFKFPGQLQGLHPPLPWGES